MERLSLAALITFWTLLGDTARAQFSQPGELDSTFNFGESHSLFTDPVNPEPGIGAINYVLSLVTQPDGKVLIGGAFTHYNGTSRNYIARLKADGTLDATFNPAAGADDYVHSIVLQPDGKVLIGGDFTMVSGIPRSRIARLNADGSLDATFNPGTGASYRVNSLVLQPDGKVLIGGNFGSYNGTIRQCIARLNADGSLDASFNPGTGANNEVRSLALQADGKVMIGGRFSSFNGTARNQIARLNADGSLDLTFNPGSGLGGFNPFLNSIAVLSDGKVLVGGEFGTYNGIPRSFLARLNADGSLDFTFNPGMGPNRSINFIKQLPNDKVFIGGMFTSYNGTSRIRIARLNANGSLDTTFNPGSGGNNGVNTLALQPDGRVWIGGYFTLFNKTIRHHIARLNTDGSLDPTCNPLTGAENWVRSIVLQPDGKVWVGGEFNSYNNTTCNRIACLNADGSLNVSFNPGTGLNGDVYSMALQPDGKVLIGGDFNTYNGTFCPRIARLNANGSLDTTFNPGFGPSSSVYYITLQPDGKVWIGGNFGSYNGTIRHRVARLNTDGSIDATFNLTNGAHDDVHYLAVQPDGKVLIGGDFTIVSGISRPRIARLNADGSLDATFNPGTGANDRVSSLVLQPDGKVLIGGSFGSYNGTIRQRIARLNADGSLDTTFNPGTGADDRVLSLALQPDGKVLIGGGFGSYNGTNRKYIARLNTNGSIDTTFNPGTGGNSNVLFLALQPDDKVLIGGIFTRYNGILRRRIARVHTTGTTTGLPDKVSKSEPDISLYPVPFRTEFTIKSKALFRYEIMDLQGVIRGSGSSQTTEATCLTENLAPGLYLVRITVNGQHYVRKVVRE